MASDRVALQYFIYNLMFALCLLYLHVVYGSSSFFAKDGYSATLTEPNIIFSIIWHTIMKTCPCNVYPLTPHFYIVKLGFTGVYIIFLFLL